jgi:repressor LexA
LCPAVARTSSDTAAQLEATVPKPLSEQERRVLDYIVEYLRSNTYQPSVREIGREFSIKSTKTVSELLQALANKGWIERDPSRSRGVRVLGMERSPGTVSLPLLHGGDAAEPAGYLELDRRLLSSETAFIIPLAEDPPASEGLRRGDLLLIDRITPADVATGDILAIRNGEAVHVRRCERAEGDTVLLAAAVAGEPPLSVSRDQMLPALVGRVCSVVRRLRPVAAHATVAVSPTAG